METPPTANSSTNPAPTDRATAILLAILLVAEAIAMVFVWFNFAVLFSTPYTGSAAQTTIEIAWGIFSLLFIIVLLTSATWLFGVNKWRRVGRPGLLAITTVNLLAMIVVPATQVTTGPGQLIWTMLALVIMAGLPIYMYLRTDFQ